MEDITDEVRKRAQETVQGIMSLAFDAVRSEDDIDAIGEKILMTLGSVDPDERVAVMICMSAMFMAVAAILRDVLSGDIVEAIGQELQEHGPASNN